MFDLINLKVLFAFAATQLLDQASCYIRLSESDVTMQVHSTFNVTLFAQNITSENNIVEFLVQHPNVLSISPKYLHVNSKSYSSNYTISLNALCAGKSEVTAKGYSLGVTDLTLRVAVFTNCVVEAASHFIGWLYFTTWSALFYPQMWSNYKRKSVVGLNLDFVVLNVFGHVYYSIFNVGLYCIPTIREQYSHRFPKSAKPIVLNDVVFAVNVTISTFIILAQCCIYDRGDQKVSNIAKLLLFASNMATSAAATLAFFEVMEWLDFIYVCSYIKLAVTLKYLPQAIMNYRRKSTEGWSILQVLFDFCGGALSLTQMFLIAYNYDDWKLFLENSTKFGLGLLTISFDCVFMVQHYVLYNKKQDKVRNDERSVQYYNVEKYLA